MPLTFPPAIYLTAPNATGIAAQDHAALAAFFDAAPNGAIIEFPRGASYVVYGGAILLRQKQLVDFNHSLVTRANEISTTTNGTVASGATSVVLTSVTGLVAGQYLALKGVDNAAPQTDVIIASPPPRIQSINSGTKTVTFEGGVVLLNVTTSTYSWSGTLKTGATAVTRGRLIDAATYGETSTPMLVENLLFDDNKANNATANRWEYSQGVAYMAGNGGGLHNINGVNGTGEGIVLWGNNPRLDGIYLATLNGNGVHFNSGSNDPFVNNVNVDTCNLDTSIGHADGAIIASDATYRAIVQQFRLLNSHCAAIGAWDQSDNAYAKISKGFVENCYTGMRLYSPASTVAADVSVKDVTVKDSGMSFIGMNSTGVSAPSARAKRFDIDMNFIDSACLVAGLSRSRVKIKMDWADSSVLNTSNAALSAASNYVGSHQAIFNAVTFTGLVSFYSCVDSDLSADVYDGAAAPVANKKTIYAEAVTGGAGPMDNIRWDLKAKGGGGVSVNAVMTGNRGVIECDDWIQNNTAIIVSATTATVDAAFVAGKDKSMDNDLTLWARQTAAWPATADMNIISVDAPGAAGRFRIRGGIRTAGGPSGGSLVQYGLRLGESGSSKYIDVDDSFTSILNGTAPGKNFPIYAGVAATDCRIGKVHTLPSNSPSHYGTGWVLERDNFASVLQGIPGFAISATTAKPNNATQFTALDTAGAAHTISANTVITLPSGTISNSRTSVFLFLMNTSGALSAVVGVESASPQLYWPAVSANMTVVGGMIVANASGSTFTNNTTALNTASVTVTYFDGWINAPGTTLAAG